MVDKLQQKADPVGPLAPIGIPPFPSVAVRALQLASSEDASMREISKLLGLDSAFSTEILRIANSSLYAVRTEIDDIFRAAAFLGLERVKAVILTVAMRRYLDGSPSARWLLSYWRHSLACALIAQELTPAIGRDKDIAYTAALIHDIGRLAIAVAYPEEYSDFVESPQNSVTEGLQQERMLFGIDHCEAGRSLASWWNLPGNLISATADHHDLTSEIDSPILRTVQTACLLASTLGFGVRGTVQRKKYQDVIIELRELGQSCLPENPEQLIAQISSKMAIFEPESA